MELSAIWYVVAIAANALVIALCIYIGVLSTAYYVERRAIIRRKR